MSVKTRYDRERIIHQGDINAFFMNEIQQQPDSKSYLQQWGVHEGWTPPTSRAGDPAFTPETKQWNRIHQLGFEMHTSAYRRYTAQWIMEKPEVLNAALESGNDGRSSIAKALQDLNYTASDVAGLLHRLNDVRKEGGQSEIETLDILPMPIHRDDPALPPVAYRMPGSEQWDRAKAIGLKFVYGTNMASRGYWFEDNIELLNSTIESGEAGAALVRTVLDEQRVPNKEREDLLETLNRHRKHQEKEEIHSW